MKVVRSFRERNRKNLGFLNALNFARLWLPNWENFSQSEFMEVVVVSETDGVDLEEMEEHWVIC